MFREVWEAARCSEQRGRLRIQFQGWVWGFKIGFQGLGPKHREKWKWWSLSFELPLQINKHMPISLGKTIGKILAKEDLRFAWVVRRGVRGGQAHVVRSVGKSGS